MEFQLQDDRCGEQTSLQAAKLEQKPNRREILGSNNLLILFSIGNWSQKIPRTQVERDIARALALWAQYSGLRFERTNDTDADIIIGFGRRYHGDKYDIK